MTDKKKILKLSQHIEKDDRIRVMGLDCLVELADINHYPKMIRLELIVEGATESKKNMIIILKWGLPVVTRK